MNHHRRTLLALATFLLLAGCKRDSPAPAPVPSETTITTPAPTPTPNWNKLIIGEWVSSPTFPTGSHDDNCATDYTFAFFPNGKYGVDSGGGSWQIQADRLTTRITEVEIDDDDPDTQSQTTIPTKRLPKPLVTQVRLLQIKDKVITATFDGKKEYWFKCSDKG